MGAPSVLQSDPNSEFAQLVKNIQALGGKDE